MIKIDRKILGISAVALATAALSSCTNEFKDPAFGLAGGNDGISLVKAPDVIAWSGNQTIGNTFNGYNTLSYVADASEDEFVYGDYNNYEKAGDRSQPNANQWGTNDDNGKYKDYPRPADITAEELEKVLAVFNQKGKTSYRPLVDWQNFFVQQVYCGPEGSKMTELATVVDYKVEIVVKSYSPYVVDTIYTKTEPMNATVNNFNNGAYNGDTRQGCMLMFNSSTLDWSWKSTQGGGERFGNWRMEYIDGAYYVGFDFQSNKQGSEANENEYQERDYIYNDWIIKIVPGIGVEIPEPDDHTGETPAGGEGEGYGDGNYTGEVTDPQPGEGDGNQNVTNVTNRHSREVEVNYAILDSHDYASNIADLVTKLSIHVRCATNVEILIPIPADYIIDSDDLYIFREHYNALTGQYEGEYGEETYNENPLSNQDAWISYDIAGKTVTLSIEFMPGDSSLGDLFARGYIKVSTQGIDQDVIDACWATNKDGINFEIYNYFQTEKMVWNENEEFGSVVSAGEINHDALIAAMNNSRITFTNNPDYYINAFGYKYENGVKTSLVHPDHAVVAPDSNYGAPARKTHLNGTPYNDIYTKNGVTETH